MRTRGTSEWGFGPPCHHREMGRGPRRRPARSLLEDRLARWSGGRRASASTTMLVFGDLLGHTEDELATLAEDGVV